MADLTVTITEAVTLEGEAQGATNTLTVADITQTMKRIVKCTNSATTTIATFAAAVSTSVGAIDVGDAKYVRVTNLDGSNSVKLGVVGTSDNYQVNLMPKTSHVLPSTAAVLLGEADTTPAYGTLEDLASLEIRNVAGAVVAVELFVASV
jgi:hypothetical protein